MAVACTDSHALVIAAINKGADVKATDQDGCTAVQHLVHAAPKNKNTNAALRARKVNEKVLLMLIANDADVNAVDQRGITPLHDATDGADDSPKRTAMVKMFRDKGAKVNALNKSGQSVHMRPTRTTSPNDERPLHAAIRKQRLAWPSPSWTMAPTSTGATP